MADERYANTLSAPDSTATETCSPVVLRRVPNSIRRPSTFCPGLSLDPFHLLDVIFILRFDFSMRMVGGRRSMQACTMRRTGLHPLLNQ